MGFGMFSVHSSPIAMDFGSATVKLLQIGAGERPALQAAVQIDIPDSIRTDPDRLMAFQAEWLPKMLCDGKFKGRRAVVAVPGSQTLIQHMQINESDGANRDDLIKSQLQAQMGCPPQGVVVRSMEVCSVHRNSQAQKELICFAIAKDTVMRYVDLLNKCKLEVVGVHTDALAMIRAFDHIHRRADDVNITTLYVDMGWGGTRVAITHGRQLNFARCIPIGGRHFDQLIAATVHCDTASARAHRLSLRSSQPQSAQAAAQAEAARGEAGIPGAAISQAAMHATAAHLEVSVKAGAIAVDRRVGLVPPELNHPVPPGEGHRKAVNVDLSELLDTITDEISMCLRYHQGLFHDRPINRAIFVGGESRQAWLCQHIVQSLRVPAQMGDPLARLDKTHAPFTPYLALDQPQPGWTVACGLCTTPADL